ncbi:amidohydrolase family protein [Prosthecobacter sp. SYSU 5D2]|uniref:amidohydrolase family protein n=1 Tax=Prosthecobacter sp. SYSU 5D2 TaxID=3134134 RepID=UPI0031FEEA77
MNPIPRRTFLQSSLAAVTTALGTQTAATVQAAPLPASAGIAPPAPGSPFIDVNVTLSHWPFRRLVGDETPDMMERLRKNGVTLAWCGSFDGILHRDIASVNRRLVEECAQHGPGLLMPVGSIHPLLPDWRHDLEQCMRTHGMKAIRLHPNYHAYKLDDPAFLELLEAATKEGLFIQIVAQLEDQRTQHSLMQAAPVDLKPLAAALDKMPQARIMVLNASRVMSMTTLRGLPVWIDIAMLEGVGGVENLLKDWPADKIVFGSHAPFFYWESARLKLQESALSPAQLAAITHGNALL